MRIHLLILPLMLAAACNRTAEPPSEPVATADTTAATATDPAAEPAQATDTAPITYADSGAVAVQIGAWRSEEAAESDRKKWLARGYEHTFVVKAGNETTGDVWFRVMLGRFNRADMADRLITQVHAKHGIRGWVNPDVH